MAHYRVFDQETASLLSSRVGSDSIQLLQTGEYFSADAGEIILAPSVKPGEVLYIRIGNGTSIPAPSTGPDLTAVPARPPLAETDSASKSIPPTVGRKSKHYVATGILGLDGEMEEETPEPPKPWWKRLFLD